MALSILHSWVPAEVLYAADLVAEFNNIYNNSLSLVSPWTGSMDANNQSLTNLDELLFRNAATTASAVGRLRRNGNNLNWHDRIGSVALQPMLGGGISGLTMSNGSPDAVNDIDIAAGAAVDSTSGTLLRLTSGITKQLDAAWAVGTNAGGLDTGSIANTTYHVYLIQRTDTGVVDAIFSTNASAPSYPTNYTLCRRIGSILRESNAIVLFTQDHNFFARGTLAANEVNATNPGAAAVTATLSVPSGINVWADIIATITDSGGAARTLYISDLAHPDTDPGSVAIASCANFATVSTGFYAGFVHTNTSRQFRYRLNASGANTTVVVHQRGWWDSRNT